MKSPLSFAVALAAFAMLSVAGTGTLAAYPGAQDQREPGAAAAAQAGMPGMANMMKMHEQMMTAMKANDAKLDALLKEVNAAKGDARIDALMATVSELARQYKAERAHMNEMHHMMMSGHEATQVSEPPAHAH